MTQKRFELRPLDGYPAEYGTLLAALQESSREWRDELGDADEDMIVWQPYPGAYSIGGVMLHIAEVEVYWIEEFCLGRKMTAEDEERFMSKDIQQYEGKWPTPPRQPLSYYYSMLDEARDRTLQAVKEMPSPEVIKPRDDFEFSMAWVLAHVVGHDSYHGGQVVMLKELYKRLAKA